MRGVTGQRAEIVTFIRTISAQHGVEHYRFRMGGASCCVFHVFNELASIIGHEDRSIFILDNATCHRHLSPALHNHAIQYLPPHSPFLAPIENYFSGWKWKVNHDLATYENLFSNIQEAREHDMILSGGGNCSSRLYDESALSAITGSKYRNGEQHCLKSD